MVKEEHVNEAVDLVANAYHEEKRAISYLPGEDYSETFKEGIKKLFANGSGIVAVLNKKPVGFLAGYEIKELWGKCRGIYCPIYAHGVINKNRTKIYQQLYQKAADLWVENGITKHSLTIYAQDNETLDTWFWMGFGLRCVDAIREVSSIKTINRNVNIKKAEETDIPSLADVQDKLHEYFRNSPMFMPVEEEDPIEHLKEWFNKDNHHIWMANDSKEERTLGLMKIEPSGERFITENPDMMNITGAYVEKSFRQKNIGASLLDAIQQWLLENDYRLCGVDYESFNISGSNFWNKYFTPYTYSLVRRINES